MFMCTGIHIFKTHSHFYSNFAFSDVFLTNQVQRLLLLGYLLHDLCFSRWLCYCQVPVFCDSIPKYDTTAVFGRTLLRSVFSVMRCQLLEKFRAEKDKMPPDKRTIVLTHFPRFGLLFQGGGIRPSSNVTVLLSCRTQ